MTTHIHVFQRYELRDYACWFLHGRPWYVGYRCACGAEGYAVLA